MKPVFLAVLEELANKRERASQGQLKQVIEVVKCVWLEKHFDQYFNPLLDAVSQECDYGRDVYAALLQNLAGI